MMIGTTHTARRALFELLLGLFSTDYLRAWLGFGLEGERVKAELPGLSASKMEVIASTVDILTRRNLVDAEFFERLHQEFTRRQCEIARVKALWTSEEYGAAVGDDIEAVVEAVLIEAK